VIEEVKFGNAKHRIELILKRSDVVEAFIEASPDGTGMPREVEVELQKYSKEFQAELLDFKPSFNDLSLRKKTWQSKVELCLQRYQ
jgi:hypothetical protein